MREGGARRGARFCRWALVLVAAVGCGGGGAKGDGGAGDGGVVRDTGPGSEAGGGGDGSAGADGGAGGDGGATGGIAAVDHFSIGLHAGSNPNGPTKKWYDNLVAATEYVGPMAQ